MKPMLALALTIFTVFTVFSQAENKPSEFNFGFEKIAPNGKLPDKWSQWGTGYSLKIDNTEKKSGNNSILIEPLPSKPENSFGAAALTIPANYEGRGIELRGFLKLQNVTDGGAGLFLRIDGDRGEPLQFDNMQSRRIQGSADWTQYSIKLPLPAEGIRIVVGALTNGKGKLWVDDLQILIDGKDIAEAKMRPPVVYKAAKDREFDAGSRIAAVKLTRSKTNDLAVLGKVWGFLKYYHPAIATGDYNWDYELFRILPKILDAKNQTQRNQVLSAWVDGLGAFEISVAEKPAAEKVKLSPDLSWINKQTLGDKLANQLTLVRDAKRQNKHYYIGLMPNVGNPQFKNEEAYKTMNYPDAGFRLLSLLRYWNIIQYYFPYKNLIEENWNDVLTEFIPKFAEAADELEHKTTALALIASIHDTHANFFGRDATLDKYRGLNSAPVAVTFVEDRAVVTKFLDGALAEKSGLKIGDVIESMNNRKVADIVKERSNLTPASNYATKLREIARDLLHTNEISVMIKFKRGRVSNELRVETYPKEKFRTILGQFFNKPIPPFKLINPDVAYLYPGSLKRGEIAQWIPEIAKTKGLIVDLRSYPSDFIVFSLGEFLMPKPTSFVKFSNGSVTTPGLFTVTEELKVGKENSNAYKGRVVILINELTQSQAEYTAMALRTAPRATVVGSTTAGADGNVSQFPLPGGIRTMISGIGVYYPDGRETQRIGIVPDIVVKPTIKGIAEGKDELLEKAMQLINAN